MLARLNEQGQGATSATVAASASAQQGSSAQQKATVASHPAQAAVAEPRPETPATETVPKQELVGLIRDAIRKELETFKRNRTFMGDVVRREAERYELIVDQEGYITLPQVTRVSAFAIHGSGGGPVFPERAWAGAGLEAANAKVRAAGYSLPLLSKCLSKAAAFGEEDATSRCPGIDSRFAPTLSDGGARTDVTYILEHGPRSWTLIDEDRRATEVSFSWGQTLASAVEAAYRTREGRHLLRCGRDKAYLTIVPKGGESSFFGIVSATDRTLDQLLLMPGDTIHATYVPPKPIRPRGN